MRPHHYTRPQQHPARLTLPPKHSVASPRINQLTSIEFQRVAIQRQVVGCMWAEWIILSRLMYKAKVPGRATPLTANR
jgi:hypothetical protein